MQRIKSWMQINAESESGFTGGHLLNTNRVKTAGIIRFPSVPSVPDDFARKGLKRIYGVRIVNKQRGLSALEHRLVPVCQEHGLEKAEEIIIGTDRDFFMPYFFYDVKLIFY